MSFQDIFNYKDHCIIITSDRIIFNAKKDNIFLLSKKDIIMSSVGDLHINTGLTDQNITKVIVNSPKIEFGISDRGHLEPIAKGQKTVDVMNGILKSLQDFTNQLKGATGTGAGTINLVQINAAASKLNVDILNMIDKVEKIKSDTTYSI